MGERADVHSRQDPPKNHVKDEIFYISSRPLSIITARPIPGVAEYCVEDKSVEMVKNMTGTLELGSHRGVGQSVRGKWIVRLPVRVDGGGVLFRDPGGDCICDRIRYFSFNGLQGQYNDFFQR